MMSTAANNSFSDAVDSLSAPAAARADETSGVYHDQFAMYEMPKCDDDSKPCPRRPRIVNKNRMSLMPQ